MNLSILFFTLCMICSSYTYAQSSSYEEMVPKNKKEHFERLKTKILKKIENDKSFNSENSRIKFAECMAYSEIMYHGDNYYEIDCSDHKVEPRTGHKLEKFLEFLHPKGRYR